MKVVVLGGGVIGISSAYFLARAGMEVTVVERRDAPALETSYANAGQVSPGYSTPWAAPGIPLKALKWLFQRHAPLSIRPDGSVAQLLWIARMLRECTNSRYAINKARMMRLAEYSRDVLRDLRQEAGLSLRAAQPGDGATVSQRGAVRCGGARRRGLAGLRRAVRVARPRPGRCVLNQRSRT